MEFETVIGLEVHLQLSTKSKIFCSPSTTFGASPNEHIDPVTLGLPGALPVLNSKVVDYAIMMGLATNCQIRRFNRFARKHYFYPDLPKGYQISQFDEPICEQGQIKIRVGDSERFIGITRIHMEEDAGKNMHDSRTNCSLVDLNRAGVPLLEIVSEPDLRSAEEASAYLKAVQQIARYLGISDGNMDEGSLRCDANISLRPKGQAKLGTRTETKNLNSFKFVEKAIEYEVARQSAILKSGQTVVQETLLFDSSTGSTRSMRSKEESSDYRYMPDPDLPPVVIEESWVEKIKSQMPVLPDQRRTSLIQDLGLSEYDATVLTSEKSFVEYFEAVLETCNNAKSACNWITSELFGALNKNGIDIAQSPIAAESLGQLIKLVDSEAISGKMAKSVFEEMFASGKTPETIVQEKGLKQVTDESAILDLVKNVFEQNPSQLQEFLGGNDRLLGFFVGLVIKAAGGAASPKVVNQVLRAEAAKLKNK
jgi:aspartyl-tRNA(Asn)/glutamyl-tRNA(Gln) amidotransferase subunit B